MIYIGILIGIVIGFLGGAYYGFNWRKFEGGVG